MSADEARDRAEACRRSMLTQLCNLQVQVARAMAALGEYSHVARVDMACEVAPMRAALDVIATSQIEHAVWMDLARRSGVEGE